jgi:hypothetical protein
MRPKTRIAGTLLILFIQSISQNLDAQLQKNTSKDSLNYFKYPNEINMGLPIFGLPASFMYKLRIPEINYVTYNRKNAVRFQFGIDLSSAYTSDSILPLNYVQIYHGVPLSPLTFPGYGYDLSNNILSSGFGAVGFEQQRQLERFHFFYGADLGIYFTINSFYDYNGISYDSAGQYVSSYFDIKEIYIGPTITPFAGFKFFITQRISAGIETGIRFGLFKRKTSYTYRDGYSGNELDYESVIRYFDIDTKYIRSISMSFYF